MKKRIYILVLFISNFFFAQNYHDTQGKLDISNSGQSTYSLPIALPPSIANVGPTINLVYASGQNGGIAGQGWNISSISYISRIATRQDIDGFRDGVDFDDNDKLSLDGQRLLIKPSYVYWADGSQYETEVQSNTKIELKGTGSNIYFVVTMPDGSRSWYGNYGSNATDLTAYYITRFEDANGNFIVYNYTSSTGNCIYIDNIQFSANINGNPNPLNKIQFNYDLIKRKETSYLKGLSIVRDKILKNVEVFTDNMSFRKYVLTHLTDSEGYQRISNIQEFNGAGEPANPVEFEYYTPNFDYYGNPNTYYNSSYNSQINLNNITLGGDFDGDGAMDFISDNSLYTKMYFNGTNNNVIPLPFSCSNRTVFPSITLNGTKINQFQSIVRANETLNSVNFEIYNKNSDGIPNIPGVNLNYIKSVLISNAIYHDATLDQNNTSVCTGTETFWEAHCYDPPIKSSNEYLPADFNGDGLGEVLIVSKKNERYYNVENYVTSDGGYTCSSDSYSCYTTILNDGEEIYYVNLDPNSSPFLGENGYIKLNIDSVDLVDSKKMIADFNGDGKADLIIIKSDKSYKVFALNQLNVSPWIQLEIIGQGSIPQYSSTKQILLGDFNGDGKTDIILPNKDGNGCEDESDCDDWIIYFNNPKPSLEDMFEAQQFDIVRYMPRRDYSYSHIFNSYYAVDINSDGKTDLLRIERAYVTGDFNRWSVDGYINRINCDGLAPFASQNYIYHASDSPPPVPIVLKNGYGKYKDIILVSPDTNKLEALKFERDLTKENNLIKVKSCSQSIIDEITYKPLVLAQSTYFSLNELNYPFVELNDNPNQYVVSDLKNTTLGVSKYQRFQYRGLCVNLNSFGVIGFMKTARSAWYNSLNFYTKTIWTCTENDFSKRGATIRNYSLLNNSLSFNILTNIGNYSQGPNWKLISKTDYNFNVSSTPFPYTILLQSQKSTDYLTNVVKETIYNSYSSDYYLLTSVTDSHYLGTILQGSTLTETTYATDVSGVGNGYYIGRPLTIASTTSAYNNLKKSLQTFDYVNGNIWHSKKNVYIDNSTTSLDPVTIVETMNYYSNGLLKDKEVSATGTTTGVNDVSARKISYTYDPTNRYVSTITDSELLVSTNMSFHPLYGTVLVTKTPFNQITTSDYDNWGKRISVKENGINNGLNISTIYTYSKIGNIYTTTITKKNTSNLSDGSISIIDQDVLAREIRRGSKNLNGTWTYVNTEYDTYGRKYRISEPYFDANSPTQWTVFEYDDYSRPIKTTSFTGKIVNTTYNGLTVTVADGVMSKSKIMDANGQIISATDTPGGIITYKYDADYNLLESNYDGIKTTMTYDNWGRKTQLLDTSSGLSTYSYDAYDNIRTERTPKGVTMYTYDGLSGRLMTKKMYALLADNITPDTSNTLLNTKIETTYAYNATTKLLSSMTVVNPNDGGNKILYTYDAQRRLYKTVETQTLLSSGTAVFTKQLAFDTFSRVNTETSTATAFGKTSTKVIKHVYSTNNGAEYQLKDNATSAVLWQANTVDARDNILTSTMGNGITVTNTFDPFGYASQFQHKLGATEVMTLKTAFEPILGNLSSRYNSMFDIHENFTYDSLDRLTAWDLNSENLLVLPFDTSTDGFTYVNDFGTTSTNGYVSASSGTMKVNLYQGVAIRTLPEIGVATGSKLRIKATITGKVGTASVVNAVMLETDPNDSTNTNEVVIGAIENGILDAEYTATDFVPEPLLSLKFKIEDNTANNLFPIGGGPVPYATFYIDNLKIDNISTTNQNYDDRGRITDNRLGNYVYSTAKPYQNTSILTGEGAPKPTFALVQSITYNAFKAPIQIVNLVDSKSISFGYNGDEQRSAMYYGSSATDKLARPNRRYYSADGSMEISATFTSGNIITPVTTEFLTYIGGTAYDATVVLKYDGTTYNYFYLHRDYQNSILAITNATGGVVEKRMFDPWGAVTQVQDGAGNNLGILTFFDRGYTGHEHLQGVGLINMNARLYNPILHRFLEADNYLQDPYNTQNYNRYSYCVNNPLKYTDSTGNFIDGGIIEAMVIGAIISALAYSASSLMNHTPFTFQGAITSVVIGAFTGAATFGIGEGVLGINNFFVRSSVQSLCHGMFQGGMTAGFNGGKFWSGFAAGSISSLASSAWSGGGSSDDVYHQGISGATGLDNGVGTIAFGTLSGGAGSALTGGNFWEGAVTGLFVSGLNHFLHDNPNAKLQRKFNRELKKAFGERLDKDATYFNGGTTNADVKTILNTDTISSIANTSGNPSVVIEDSETSDRGASSTYHSTAEEKLGAGLKAAMPNQSGKIRLYQDCFRTPRYLANKILHEFGHAYLRYHGYTLRYFKAFGWDKAIYLEEIRAYGFANSYGVSFFENGGYQRGLQIAIKALGLKW